MREGDEGALRVIVAGGGTGGHLFPGLAVADQLRERWRAEVSFVGAANGIESRVVPTHGYPLHMLPIRALRGQGLLATLSGVVRFGVSMIFSWRILARLQPHLVIGVGGYASAPAVLAARIRRIPTVLLEQNAHPGVTNRWLGRVCDRVCISFPESRTYFPKERTVETGNPVRSSPVRERTGDHGFAILIFGGSAGARRLNEIGVEAFHRLGDEKPQIRHQTGMADLESVRSRYEAYGIAADVTPFIDDMATAYADADLVICRAGATTLAELTAIGKPAILVPYPYAADDHQRENAESLVRRGAAEMILDQELAPEVLASAIDRLREDHERLRAMAVASRALGCPDATDRVADVCLNLIKESWGIGKAANV